MHPQEQRPSSRYVVGFILILVIAQAAAFGKQFTEGFIPFVREPGRVPFSWDMFSNPVERCEMSWNPPIKIGPHLLPNLRSVELPLEWDITFDRAAFYKNAGMGLCHIGKAAPTQIKLHCFMPNGTEMNDEFNCD